MSSNVATGSSSGVVMNQSLDIQNDQFPVFSYPDKKASRPLGVLIFGSYFKFNNVAARRTFHKALVLCVTFIAYTCYHMGRRPLSIVKNVLNRNCTDVHHLVFYDEANQDLSYIDYESALPNTSNTTWCDWAPFDNNDTANQLLALLDSAFLFSYAFFMFFSGFLADRCNLRYFLSAGMIASGLLLYSFGLAFYLNIHSLYYFVIIQALSGAIQTTGWPAMVSCIGNWFESSTRGSVFGLWNANTSIGNILGTMIAGYFVERAWGLSFMVPGFIMMSASILVFLFLVPRPEDVALTPIRNLHALKTDETNYSGRDQDIEEAVSRIVPTAPDSGKTNRRKPIRPASEIDSAISETDDSHTINNSEHSPLISGSPEIQNSDEVHSVSFLTCLKIPGVIEYSLCLGFAKLVSYTFLYWLPRYITQSTLNNSEESAYLSVPFDIGGMFGAIFAGFISDKYKKNATICTAMLVLAIPSMYIYEKYASISDIHNIGLQLLTGSLVSGPYALITTAVSTDLGSRIKDGKAMATVAAIIDGTGSIGAAIGPLFAGFVSDSGWQIVFMVLMLSDLIASLCLTRLTLKEIGLSL